MRLLADENTPRLLINALRASGHDVRWVSEFASGSHDSQIMHVAVAEQRIVLTRDKDFGLISREVGRVGLAGVILLRLSLPPVDLVKAVMRHLASRDDWSGQMSVIDGDRLRMRRLNNG